VTTSTANPERLGGLAWAQRTGGALTARERARLLAAISLGQWQNVIGRVKLQLGRLPPGAATGPLRAAGALRPAAGGKDGAVRHVSRSGP
jgi:hypothetical protein